MVINCHKFVFNFVYIWNFKMNSFFYRCFISVSFFVCRYWWPNSSYFTPKLHNEKPLKQTWTEPKTNYYIIGNPISLLKCCFSAASAFRLFGFLSIVSCTAKMRKQSNTFKVDSNLRSFYFLVGATEQWTSFEAKQKYYQLVYEDRRTIIFFWICVVRLFSLYCSLLLIVVAKWYLDAILFSFHDATNCVIINCSPHAVKYTLNTLALIVMAQQWNEVAANCDLEWKEKKTIKK